MRDILAELGLELYPDKTRAVDLREGRENFGLLGCVSSRLWGQRGIVRYYLHEGDASQEPLCPCHIIAKAFFEIV